ncbi:MAG: insulinase family protein [Gammaproteobacteria bacterium]|nr:insulinase family protein [Gammaproteobacteria bacterium]
MPHPNSAAAPRLLLAAALAWIGLWGCAAPPVAAPAAQPVVVKSPNDERAYRYLELANGLRALLASDPKADKAAASLTVFRGSFHEPAERPGLAHFLEHMLFIGTEKYPEVDGYQAFVSAHGGSSNAYTASDHTNYFFDIDPAHFQAGMDRFAQFFIAPLLDPAYVERERNAVHSEYQLQLKDDGWRAFAASKMALNPAHPLARFNIGSLETLGDDALAALEAFFKAHYSADQMALVALSNESLDDLQAWVAPLFEGIANRQLGAAPVTTPPYPADGLPATLRIQPQKEIRSASYEFPVPSTRPHYRTKPERYLTNLLGHEGVGSLHAALKARGWIESLNASSAHIDDATSAIDVTIGLTPAGSGRIEAISAALFAYLDLLRSEAPSRWRYREQARIAETHFRFQEPSSALGFVYRVGPTLAHLPPVDLLRAPYLMDEFDPALIERYLARLTPRNVRLTVIEPDAATDRIEPWFKVPYALEQRPIAMEPAVGKTRFEFHLPAKNPFIPEDLTTLPDDPGPPRRIKAAEGIEAWLDRDLAFGAPRANLRLLLTVPDGGLASVEDQVAASIYRDLVADQLNAYAYPAGLAGLSFGIGLSARGFLVEIGGYTDKQDVLLPQVLEALNDAEIEPATFARLLDERVRGWRNEALERPYSQAYGAIGKALQNSAWPAEMLASAAERLTVEALRAWRSERLTRFGLVALLHGNLDEERAIAIVESVRKRLPVEAVPPFRVEIAQVADSYRVPLAIDHADAAVALYVQDEQPGVNARAQSALAAQLVKQAFFTELRTEQQLGYAVFARATPFRNQGGLTFIVQSPVASPAALEEAILTFLDARPNAVRNLSEEAFSQFKAGLISDLTEREKNLNQRSRRLWRDLDLGYVNFDANQQLADAFAELSQAAMADFMDGLRQRARSQRLIIYSMGKFEEPPAQGELIEDLTWLKAARP